MNVIVPIFTLSSSLSILIRCQSPGEDQVDWNKTSDRCTVVVWWEERKNKNWRHWGWNTQEWIKLKQLSSVVKWQLQRNDQGVYWRKQNVDYCVLDVSDAPCLPALIRGFSEHQLMWWRFMPRSFTHTNTDVTVAWPARRLARSFNTCNWNNYEYW